MSTDPRLQIHGVSPTPGRTFPAVYDEFDSHRQRYTVKALGTKTLGYAYLVGVRADGTPTLQRSPGGTYSEPAARHMYRATSQDDEQYDDLVDTLVDAVALVVGAAHSTNPAPEHVVPRTVGGRPVRS